MTHKLIGVRELAKTGIFSKKRFYRLLSEQNNYADPEAMKEFYLGLVRCVTKELKEKGVVRLPYLGDFILLRQKPAVRWMGKSRVMAIGTYMLKFRPNDTWKRYFNKMSKISKDNGTGMDPRERLLNEILE